MGSSRCISKTARAELKSGIQKKSEQFSLLLNLHPLSTAPLSGGSIRANGGTGGGAICKSAHWLVRLYGLSGNSLHLYKCLECQAIEAVVNNSRLLTTHDARILRHGLCSKSAYAPGMARQKPAWVGDLHWPDR